MAKISRLEKHLGPGHTGLVLFDALNGYLHPESPAKGDVLVPKQRWSSFFQTHLDLQLKVRGIDTILIAGGSTDVGIASTVFAARDLDYGIAVVRDACYSSRGNNHDFFMDRVFPRMARVMSVDDAVSLMI